MEDLNALADEQLELARRAEHGRSAHLFLRDGPLRQSVIALRAGAELGEHDAPPASSLQVLRGTVRLTGDEVAGGEGGGSGAGAALAAGVVTELPEGRHGLRADQDAAVLLTAVTAV
ncbi:cupin [Streptomyces sp. SM14]|uniref:cupin n=1 Tax=Streptomyces sp. SM14 TaxID=1736045 RepID=UPI000CD5A09D|nr:cupin [Streptomyces sp. SM14]